MARRERDRESERKSNNYDSLTDSQSKKPHDKKRNQLIKESHWVKKS